MKKIPLILSIALVTKVASAVAYTQNFTSGFGTIVIEAIQMFFMNLGTIPDRIMILFGSDRANDSLESKLYDISLVPSEAADIETATHIITTTCLWILFVGLIVWGLYKLLSRKKGARNG